jgi:hypothetical protein
MYSADANGWNDCPEDEREGLDIFADGEAGKYDLYEGWPEGTPPSEYWLYKRDLED